MKLPALKRAVLLMVSPSSVRLGRMQGSSAPHGGDGLRDLSDPRGLIKFMGFGQPIGLAQTAALLFSPDMSYLRKESVQDRAVCAVPP